MITADTLQCVACSTALPRVAKYCFECGITIGASARANAGGVSFAVVDVETTGFYAQGTDRIVEVAVVQLDENSRTTAEYSSLVNPGRDLGPTPIHGILGRDARDAPPFVEVADDLVRWLAGRVIVAHSAPFDIAFLTAEFARLGYDLPALAAIDTRLLTGMSLADACDLYGVKLKDAHTALGDAKATAELFRELLKDDYSDAETLADLECHLAPAAPDDWPTIRGELTEYRRPERAGDDEQSATPEPDVPSGKTICFTGVAPLSVAGRQIDREWQREAAGNEGYVVKGGVSKKIDFLVAADPDSLSGKARKARQYGIPIMPEPQFWQAIGVSLDAI